jgi:uncharacterized membrane protein
VTRRRRTDERGAVLPLVALVLGVLLLFASIAIDLGYQRVARRDMQALADVVAMDMASELNGTSVAALTSTMNTAMSQSVARNAGTNAGITPTVTYRLGTASGTTHAFTVAASSADIPNAVEVTATTTVNYFFHPGSDSTFRTAVATQQKLAGFSMGSFALRLASGNSVLLNALLNDALNVSGVSYQGLANGAVTLPLLASALGLDIGNTNSFLNTNFTLTQFLNASATALQANGGDFADVQLLQSIAATIPNGGFQMSVGDIIALGQSGANGADATLNALDILMAAGSISNGSSALNFPVIAANAGITNLATSLSLIQGPVRAYGPVGTSAETQQIDVPMTFNVLPTGSGLTAAAAAAFTTSLVDAVGTITNISCAQAAKTLSLLVDPELAHINGTITLNLNSIPAGALLIPALQVATLGAINNATRIVVTVTTSAGTGNNETATFTVPPDVLDEPGAVNPTVVNAGAGSFGLSAVTTSISIQNASGPIGGLSSAVVNQILGVVNPVMTTLATTVSNNVLSPLLQTLLGLDVTGADVTATDIDCAAATLVA